MHGPPTERFVYVDIGTYAGQKDTLWSRRLKVPLSGITWGLINKVAANPGAVLEARSELRPAAKPISPRTSEIKDAHLLYTG